MTKPTLCTFWAGRASPYQTLCISSWVAHGFNVVVYTTDTDLKIPRGAEHRPAEDILDLGGHIHRYKNGFGAGSPSLHSNLFRYRLVERGGWWLDTDVVMLRADLPETDFFLARQAYQDSLGIGIMRLPARSPVICDAIREIEAVIDKAEWGQTGPDLITRLVEKYGLAHKAYDRRTAYEIDYTEAIKLFDPDARGEVEDRVASSLFVHLWNEIWNAIGFPQDLGPPEGSYLDGLVERFGSRNMFPARVPFASVRTWWENREHRMRLARELREARSQAAPPPSFTFGYSYRTGAQG
jgi:hypothetical protein